MTRLGLVTGAAFSLIALSLSATAAEMPEPSSDQAALTGSTLASLPAVVVGSHAKPRIVLAQRRQRRGANRPRARRRAIRRSRRRRGRAGRIAGGIAAAIIAGIIANEIARADQRDWGQRCRRWYRRCDDGFARACRRFYRHCY